MQKSATKALSVLWIAGALGMSAGCADRSVLGDPSLAQPYDGFEQYAPSEYGDAGTFAQADMERPAELETTVEDKFEEPVIDDVIDEAPEDEGGEVLLVEPNDDGPVETVPEDGDLIEPIDDEQLPIGQLAVCAYPVACTKPVYEALNPEGSTEQIHCHQRAVWIERVSSRVVLGGQVLDETARCVAHICPAPTTISATNISNPVAACFDSTWAVSSDCAEPVELDCEPVPVPENCTSCAPWEE